MYIETFTGILLVLAFYFIFSNFSQTNNIARILFSITSLVIGLRYLDWRLFDTVIPFSGSSIEATWVWLVFIIECLIYLEVFIFLVTMSRYKSREEEAQDYKAKFEKQNNYPLVDVFIPTYNEPLSVLEKTIIGSSNLDYPNLVVWVLDDGKRDWLKDYCETFDNVKYLTREDNKHAKAGNLNNGLKYATGKFIVIMDADFVPHREFIRETIGFFDDPKIGIVQTPQYFFNNDPIQNNLGLNKDWPDEQRLFFDKMAECRDAWDVSFCCGSCSISRREALDAIGGFPTESITEDLLTTLKMYRKGYITRYLNRRLSMGLAAESLEAFFVQRSRWCQGGIQSIFLKEGPLGPSISWFKRLMFFPWSWLIQYPSRFIIMIIPMVYLWTGMSPLEYTSFSDILNFQAPMFLMYFLTMLWLLPGHYMPVLTTSQGLFATFRMLPVVITSLIKPFGTPFRVTPKGHSTDVSFDVVTFTFIAVTVIATIFGIVINILPETQILTSTEFFPIALFWALFNVLTLTIAGLMCFDAPRKRVEERFSTNEKVVLHGDKNSEVSTALDISVEGLRTYVPKSNSNITHITLRNVGKIEVEVVRKFPWKNPIYCTYKFKHTKESRIKIIQKLFSGKYNNAIVDYNTNRVVKQLFKRAFGKSL